MGCQFSYKSKIAASEDISEEINPIAWCKSHTMELSKWAKTGSFVEAERVFSILQDFTASLEDYLSSMEDYLELCYLCCNTTLLIRFH